MLRDFQIQLDTDIDGAYAEGAKNVMPVAPTGSGKTVIIGHRLKKLDAPACAIAHRQELVSQIALALNREEVPHGIIAPKATMREIIALQMDTHGRSYYNPQSHIRVAGVDTLPNHDKTDRWLQQVQLVIQDEGHHVLAGNKWGRAMGFFPNARGLFPTAHAVRADGRGLGRHADGLVDRLVIGPSCRTLINRGFLTDYRLIAPPSDIELTEEDVSDSTGDFKENAVRAAVHASPTIVGSVVDHYIKFAEGLLGITFAVDIQSANELATEYCRRGIPASVIHGKTGTADRAQLMRKFRGRHLLQLVSVDVLGEGTDVPAIEVVSMARPTASFQLYAQQAGRLLRIMVTPDLMLVWDTFTDEMRLHHIARSVKPSGILIDHVNNYVRHGLPDRPRAYTLDRREKKSRPADDAIPLRTCLNPECLRPYEVVLLECPYCTTARPAPKGRSTPAMVDGDLVELDPEVLRQLRGEIDRIDNAPSFPRNASPAATGAIKRNHWDRQQHQAALRDAIATWAGWQQHMGRPDRESYRRFYHGFGIDIATAQTLGAKDATELEARIRTQLAANNIVKVS